MENTIFELCSFRREPLDKDSYIEDLVRCLRSGIPATITTKDLVLASTLDINPTNNQEIDGGDIGTSPLHRICESLDPSPGDIELGIAEKMIDILFQNGANWMMRK
jgi:protein arginine N-methyltransferase 2